MHLNFVLLSDGSSDQALIPILEDALYKYSVFNSIQGQRADLSRYNRPLRRLEEKIDCAVDLYNPDVIFIHRDAEKKSLQDRVNEIDHALSRCKIFGLDGRDHVKVIPIRMTEAWLLIDEMAIKKAAGNPTFKERLNLPKRRALENIPNPKSTLTDLIKKASNLHGRRLKKLNLGHCIQLIPRYIEDFTPLSGLPSYKFLLGQINDKLK
jgi:hypothetical protein